MTLVYDPLGHNNNFQNTIDNCFIDKFNTILHENYLSDEEQSAENVINKIIDTEIDYYKISQSYNTTG